MTDHKIRVVVADDQDLIRSGFGLMLSAEPDIVVVGEASDGIAAVRVTDSFTPDVVLMDIRMPGFDGIEATRRICARTSTRVLILTTYDLDEYVYAALRAGASGFLLKDARRADLVDAVRVVAAGNALLAPTITRRLIANLVARSVSPPKTGSALKRLTPRETETLRLVARGYSNAEIALALHVTEHTVKTHVSSLLGKLELRDRVQAVAFAYESGLVVPGAE